MVFIAEKILVTAALPYANGPLHLGHLRSTYIPSDVYARFQRSRGNDVVYVCATDEHGTPIVASAEKEKKTPQQFTDYYHEKDEKEFQQLGLSFDIFHRTSSKENREMAQHFYGKLKQNGFVYEQEIAQAYCEKCGRFLPDRFVVGTCPHCKSERQYSDYCDACGKALHAGEILSPQCLVCGTAPTTKTTNHFFLALSKFAPQLRAWLSSNKNLQPTVLNYILNWIDGGLKDWDITRELDWGVPIPGVPGKVFYVWFDAPIGYVSSTVAARPKDWQDYWKNPETRVIHFIGKDIIYHHFLFWPAMLMGVNDGFNLPTAIPVRGYLNLEGGKFSKSKGHFVSIEDYLNAFPPDYLRYYETIITPYSTEDADWYWKDFQDKINNELVANIGNFVHRTLVLIKKLNNSEIPAPSDFDARDQETLALIEKNAEKTALLIDHFELKSGLDQILKFSSELNKYLSDRQPWKETSKAKNANTLYICSRGVTALAILLEPFLPFSSRKIFSMLELKEEQLKWENASKELLAPNTKIGEISHLFEKIPDEKIKLQEEKLRKKL